MIFRPLCVDYRLRAQEILVIEGENHARRAASSLLSHHVVRADDRSAAYSDSNLHTPNNIKESNKIPLLEESHGNDNGDDQNQCLVKSALSLDQSILIDNEGGSDYGRLTTGGDDEIHETITVLCSKGGHFLHPKIQIQPMPSPGVTMAESLRQWYHLIKLFARQNVALADLFYKYYRPELKILYGETNVDFQKDDFPTKSSVYIRPKINLETLCDIKQRSVDHFSRIELVPFTSCFIKRRHDSSSSTFYSPQIIDSVAFGGNMCVMIIDPRIRDRTETCSVIKRENDQAALNKLLDGFCSTSYISAMLKLSTRFEIGHNMVLSIQHPRYKLLDEIIRQHNPVFKDKLLEVALDIKLEQSQLEMKLPYIANMASFAEKRSVLYCDAVKELGEIIKKECGFQLMPKTNSNEREERVSFEEHALLNPKSSKEDILDISIEPNRKREDTFHHSIDVSVKKDKKKKRKKSKRVDETDEERSARKAIKKKKRKERHKRKRRYDSQSDSNIPTKIKVDDISLVEVTAEGNRTNEPDFVAKPQNVKVAASSLKVSITPIDVSKRKMLKQGSNNPNNTFPKTDLVKKNDFDSVVASHKIKDSILQTVNQYNSSDSMTSLNESRKLLFFQTKKNETSASLENHLSGSTNDNAFDNESTISSLPPREPQIPDESQNVDAAGSVYNMSENSDKVDDEIQVVKGYNNGKLASCEDVNEIGSVTLLSSEFFLEEFTEVVTELASGRWRKTLAPNEKIKVEALKNDRVTICDSPLVDIAGVDIELSEEKGLIVNRLSSWTNDDHSVQESARTFIRKLVLLAASGRYKCLHIVLCVDVDITPTISHEIVTLQNALVMQPGCYCNRIAFEFVTPRVLSATLALHLITNQSQIDNISHFVADEHVVERARFLMMLVPSMTVRVALKCLGSTNQDSQISSGEAFFGLLHAAKSMKRENFVDNTTAVLSDTAANQLWLALHVDISHAC